MSPARIEQTTVANREEDARLASIAPLSPTGTPLIPAKWAPYLMVASVVLGIPALLVGAGVAIPVAVVAVTSTLAGVCVVLLGGSPGVRKSP